MDDMDDLDLTHKELPSGDREVCGCQILKADNGFILDFMNNETPMVFEQKYDYDTDASNFQHALRQAFLEIVEHFDCSDSPDTQIIISIKNKITGEKEE